MTITFRCEHCHKDVTAPDSAAGKRGKCPHCGQTGYIPAPVSEDDVLDLAPVDEDEERRRQQEIEALRQQERELIAQTGGGASVPLDQREDLTSEDLHHFVVNYCLDMANGRLERAQMHAEKLGEFGPVGRQAVRDFQNQDVDESALEDIPEPVRMGFLKQLAEQMG